MKRLVLSLMTAALAFATSSLIGAPSKGNTGLGVILGEPTGISLKVWTGRRTALDVAAAWSFAHHEQAVHFHADYLVHDFTLLRARRGRLAVYYGIGGRIKLEDTSRIGIRIPVGICYDFARAPLDLFFELAPLLDLAPETEASMTGAVGIRYYF